MWGEIHQSIYCVYTMSTPPTLVGGDYKIADVSLILFSAESRSACSNGVH